MITKKMKHSFIQICLIKVLGTFIKNKIKSNVNIIKINKLNK